MSKILWPYIWQQFLKYEKSHATKEKIDWTFIKIKKNVYHASNLDWRFVSYMILYMFQCHSPKSSHPLPFPQSPKDCSIHLCTMLLKSLMHHDRSSAVSLLLSLKVTWDYQVHLFLPWDSSLKTSTLVSKIFCFHSPSVIIPNLNMSSQDYIWLMGDKCIQYFARWSKDSL